MTLQEIFDKVATHLLTQNKRAMKNGQCRYRTEDGRSCAVGCLIPDDKYSEEFEGKTIGSLRIRDAIGVLKEKSVELLIRLQNVHDLHNPGEWPDHLARTARTFGLTTTVLDSLHDRKNRTRGTQLCLPDTE